MMELKVFSSFLLSSLHNLSTMPACVVSWVRVSTGEREDFTIAKKDTIDEKSLFFKLE